MSMPNFPEFGNIPEINPEAAISIVLISIALEEMGLAHIINAEGEKIQEVVFDKTSDIYDLLAVNESVEKTLRTVVKSQIVTEFKFQEALEALKHLRTNHTYGKK